jgi:acetyltransferase-like isoleucine patch superfamily enzyme
MKLSRIERVLFSFIPNFLLRRVLPKLKKYHFFANTANTQTPISFDLWYNQFVKNHCSDAYWPVHFTSIVSGATNIYCGIETSPGYSPGNYIQAMGKIYIGDYTQIAPNVGIITGNHDLYDNSKHIVKDVIIGKYCWIGMNSVILPGVTLGDYTIVAAGSIVTKSFKDGYCVIAGNEAKEIKKIDMESCIFHKSTHEYNGYIRNQEFDKFRQQYLNV